MKKKAKIFTPIYQQGAFLLYCKNHFDYDEVNFESSIDKNSDFFSENIIDVSLLNTIDENTLNNRLKYKIFFFNGEKQYFENLSIIKKLKNRLNQNLTFFFVGNVTSLKNIEFVKSTIGKKNFKYSNVTLRHRIAFSFPYLFSLIAIFKNFKFFLLYNNKEKICFTGLVKVEGHLINHLKNDWKFSKKSIQILKKTQNLKSNNISLNSIKLFKLYLNSEYYSKLPMYEKYFISQIIFRNFICILLKKNKNFYLQDWDNRINIMDSFFFKKFIFLDLGSTAGSEKNYHRAYIMNHFKKNFLRINFYDKSIKSSLKIANIKILNLIIKMISLDIENLNIKQLKDHLTL